MDHTYNLSCIVVQEPCNLPNVQIRHRSESLTLRLLPPTNRVGNGPGMMGARNAGREEVHLRGCSMRYWVLRLVCVVFVNGRLIGLAAMHTLAQGPTPTGPALNSEPGTMPTNQANQLNPPPPSPSPRTNSWASGSVMNTTTGIGTTYIRTLRRPGPLALPSTLSSLRRHQTHAGGKNRPHPTQTTPALAAPAAGRRGRSGSATRARRCARSSRPRTAKSGCGATV